jgi:hypothetical protein
MVELDGHVVGIWGRLAQVERLNVQLANVPTMVARAAFKSWGERAG